MENEQYQRMIAMAGRAVAEWGVGETIGGHISLRVPGEDAYWTHILDPTLEELRPEHVVKLDWDNNVIYGDGFISPGIDFHSGIYQLRPDVNAIVHTHGPWTTAFASKYRPPKMYQNLCTFFYKNCAIAPDDNIAEIGPVLGDNDTVLIPWHAGICVGSTLGRAAALNIVLEMVAELDVRLSGTDATEMPEDRCEDICKLVESAGYLERMWQLSLRKMERRMNSAEAVDPFPVEDWRALFPFGS